MVHFEEIKWRILRLDDFPLLDNLFGEYCCIVLLLLIIDQTRLYEILFQLNFRRRVVHHGKRGRLIDQWAVQGRVTTDASNYLNIGRLHFDLSLMLRLIVNDLCSIICHRGKYL